MWPFNQIERLERAAPLDAVAARVRPLVDKALANRRVTDALHGVWLGHPLHPVLVQVPVGAWTSAAILDSWPGGRRAATLLIGVGLAGAVPAAAAGVADWSQQDTQQQRTGLAHAMGNVAALSLYSASLLARGRANHSLGRALAYAGFALAGASATVGGHLAYRQTAGPSHAVPHAEIMEPGWADLGALNDLPDGQPAQRSVGEVPLFVLRRGARVHALIDRCSHASGPLHEGELSTEAGRTCITCPWHGSTFRVDDGQVVHGPATAGQPVLQVRIEADRVSVRLPGLSMGNDD